MSHPTGHETVNLPEHLIPRALMGQMPKHKPQPDPSYQNAPNHPGFQNPGHNIGPQNPGFQNPGPQNQGHQNPGYQSANRHGPAGFDQSAQYQSVAPLRHSHQEMPYPRSQSPVKATRSHPQENSRQQASGVYQQQNHSSSSLRHEQPFPQHQQYNPQQQQQQFNQQQQQQQFNQHYSKQPHNSYPQGQQMYSQPQNNSMPPPPLMDPQFIARQQGPPQPSSHQRPQHYEQGQPQYNGQQSASTQNSRPPPPPLQPGFAPNLAPRYGNSQENHSPSRYSHPSHQGPKHHSSNPNLGYVPQPRRVITSPTVPTYREDQPQPLRKEREAKEARTKSMSSQHASSQAGAQQNNRSPSTGSSHTFSFSSKSRSLSSLGKLSSLSTKKFSSSASLQKDRNVSSSTITSRQPSQRKPIVYPAVLSRVAKAFKESMVLDINMKDGLEYHDSFTGRAAIDVICNIIRTNDRNLALLLGRALDAQKFFHDVTYNHRLRDSANEIYNFTRVYSGVEFFDESGSNNNSNRTSLQGQQGQQAHSAPYPVSNYPPVPDSPIEGFSGSFSSLNKVASQKDMRDFPEQSRVNGVFTILTECYSPTCSRNNLCYSIACPRRLEQQARLHMKPRGGLKRAVSRLSLHDNEKSRTLWHETVDESILEKLDKREKMRQELIYELIYTERDYVKDLEFMTDFYIMPLRNPANNIIPERERDAFIRTVFGGVSELLRLAKSLSEALTARQQAQKPVVESIADVFLSYIGSFDPFIKYSGNKVFASFEHERQQQVNMKYARFLEAIEKKPESRKQDFSSFLIKGVQRPARYQLLLSGILKNTKEDSPDYKNLVKAKEEIEKLLVRINIQTGEATDRHKIMVLHRLLGRQTLEGRYNFRLNYSNRIVYQVTLSRKRDNEKIDLYLFEHALLLVKHKIQNKREVYKVFERPMYLPLLFVNSGFEIPTPKSILPFREDGSLISDSGLKNKQEVSQYNPVSSSQQKLQLNFFGLGSNSVHVSLFADDVTNQNQVLSQIQQQQTKLLEKHDIFSLCKYEQRRFTGNNRINCAVPCYGGKKLLYGTDLGVWVSTVRSISMTSTEKICSDPTMVISKPYVTQLEVLVEYSKLLVLSDKTLYEFDLSCTDSLDHVKNTRSGKVILNSVSYFKTSVCDGKLLCCAIKSGNARAISIVEPTNPFDKSRNKNKKPEVREISFSSDPISISFLKTKLCIGCTKGFEILSLEAMKKEPILDEADPSLDFATQRESVTPLAIHRLDRNFLLSYSEFSFFINPNGWRTKHDWGIFWEGTPQNIALFYPYLLAFDPSFIEIRDLESTTLIRALVGENIRFLHSNEHEALYACEENGYDIIVSIDFLNLKPKAPKK